MPDSWDEVTMNLSSMLTLSSSFCIARRKSHRKSSGSNSGEAVIVAGRQEATSRRPVEGQKNRRCYKCSKEGDLRKVYKSHKTDHDKAKVN